jgi:hypothetical protein
MWLQEQPLFSDADWQFDAEGKAPAAAGLAAPLDSDMFEMLDTLQVPQADTADPALWTGGF